MKEETNFITARHEDGGIKVHPEQFQPLANGVAVEKYDPTKTRSDYTKKLFQRPGKKKKNKIKKSKKLNRK